MPDNDDDKQTFMFTHLRPFVAKYMFFFYFHSDSFTSQTKNTKLFRIHKCDSFNYKLLEEIT